MTIPDEAAGRIIGKAGATLQEIRTVRSAVCCVKLFDSAQWLTLMLLDTAADGHKHQCVQGCEWRQYTHHHDSGHARLCQAGASSHHSQDVQCCSSGIPPACGIQLCFQIGSRVSRLSTIGLPPPRLVFDVLPSIRVHFFVRHSRSHTAITPQTALLAHAHSVDGMPFTFTCSTTFSPLTLYSSLIFNITGLCNQTTDQQTMRQPLHSCTRR